MQYIIKNKYSQWATIYNATLLKTGQIYMLNKETVDRLYYPYRVVQ